MLSIDGLSKIIQSQTIIDGLSFNLKHKQKVCLFAPSGSGKSTLINILIGTDKEFRGNIQNSFDAVNVIFQEPRLFWYKTIKENIFYPLEISGRSMNQPVLDDYDEWMAICDLKKAEGKYPHEVSGGMKQKASIVRSLLMQSDLLLMDEPFKSIDVASKRKITTAINRFYPDMAILMVTHNLDEVPLITDEVCLFKEVLSNDYQRFSSRNKTDWQAFTEQIFSAP